MKKYIWFALLVIFIVPSFFKLIRPGFFPIQDDMQVFRLYEMDRCFSDYQIPCRWIPDGGYQYGYPQFNFYSPLVYYIGEVIHLLGLQFVDAVKILIALGFLGLGLSMFILLKEFVGKFSAFVGALLYVYAPYHAQQVYVRGSLSEFWAGIFFPLILWAIYKNKFVLTSLSIAGLFLTHNILSFLFLPIIVFWIGYWKKFNWGVVLGVALSAFFLLPMIFERGYVHVDTLLGGYFDYRQHFVTLKELFFSNHWGYGSSFLGPIDDLSLSTGIVHWICGVLAIVMGFLNFKRNRKFSLLILSLGVIELVVLFLMHERSSFIWGIIKPLSWLQFPWRFLSISVFILSILSGYAIDVIGKTKYFLGIIVVIAVFTLHLNFFTPKEWLPVTDADLLTGQNWEKQLTASIFDYLPIGAVLPPDSKAPNVPEVLDGSAIFIVYEKGSYYQRGLIKVIEDATIRIPIYDFPGMEVSIDEKKVMHQNDDCRGQTHCLGLVTFKVPEGKHSIKVILKNTRVRDLGNAISLMIVLLVIFKSTTYAKTIKK